MKLTAIFRGCYQDGMDHWSNYVTTKNIPLTEAQNELLTAPKGMTLSEIIIEQEDTANDK